MSSLFDNIVNKKIQQLDEANAFDGQVPGQQSQPQQQGQQPQQPQNQGQQPQQQNQQPQQQGQQQQNQQNQQNQQDKPVNWNDPKAFADWLNDTVNQTAETAKLNPQQLKQYIGNLIQDPNTGLFSVNPNTK